MKFIGKKKLKNESGAIDYNYLLNVKGRLKRSSKKACAQI